MPGAVDAARAAVVAHVAALPSLRGADRRVLGTALVRESAVDLALLGELLGEPAAQAFPGAAA